MIKTRLWPRIEFFSSGGQESGCLCVIQQQPFRLLSRFGREILSSFAGGQGGGAPSFVAGGSFLVMAKNSSQVVVEDLVFLLSSDRRLGVPLEFWRGIFLSCVGKLLCSSNYQAGSRLVVICVMLLYSYGIGFYSSCSGGQLTFLFLLPSSCALQTRLQLWWGGGLLFSCGMWIPL